MVMPLKAFVKTNDPGTISSLKIGNNRRRLVKPTPKQKWVGQNTIYVNPCQDHGPGHPVVPVDIYAFDKEVEGGRFLARVSCCPMCWKILKDPRETSP